MKKNSTMPARNVRPENPAWIPSEPPSCRINFRSLRKDLRETDAGTGAAIFKDVLNAISHHF